MAVAILARFTPQERDVGKDFAGGADKQGALRADYVTLFAVADEETAELLNAEIVSDAERERHDEFAVEQLNAVVFREDAGDAELVILRDGKAVVRSVGNHPRRSGK